MKVNIFILSILLFLGNAIYAQDQSTESPYFQVENELPEGFNPSSFALINSNVSVQVSGVIAEITVEQEYANNSDLTLNTHYVFPGSSQSAIYYMEMELDGRVIKAKVKEKEEAKQIFETAKKEGKSASLLEQHRPNIFQMSLANIKPKSTVFVRFKYTETLSPTQKIYEFVFPTLVGPRYATREMAAEDPWVSNPFVNNNAPNSQVGKPGFSLNLTLNAGMPINKASWLSHPNAAVEFTSNTTLKTAIANSDKEAGDFIFRYQLAGEKIASGLLLYEGEKENFFMYTMQPPVRPSDALMPPRDYIFIVDISGSMNGFPIEVSKKLITSILRGLNKTDRFNILLFAGSSEQFASELMPATDSYITEAIKFINNQHGSGGTEILPALERALDMMEDGGRSSTVVIATDGLVTVERDAIALIEDNLGKANFFPFGIGASSNRYIIEALANAGMSEAFICTSENEAIKKAEEFKEMVTNPVLTDIKVKFNGMKTYDVLPKNAPDLFGDKPLVIFGKYESAKDGKITVKGQNAAGKFSDEFAVAEGVEAAENGALKYLWARQKIKMLSDYNRAEPEGKLKEEIIALGLNYNLLTEFTSFVAVDDNQEKMTENSPPPPPASNSSGAVPEPHEWTLIIVGLLLLGFLIVARFNIGK
jgi:Ca-activated chloride channel family protein